jgi:hypothetical protein
MYSDEMVASYWLASGSFIVSAFHELSLSYIIKRGDLEISHIELDVHL